MSIQWVLQRKGGLAAQFIKENGIIGRGKRSHEKFQRKRKNS